MGPIGWFPLLRVETTTDVTSGVVRWFHHDQLGSTRSIRSIRSASFQRGTYRHRPYRHHEEHEEPEDCGSG